MLDLAAELLAILRSGESVAVVTIAGVPRSAPRGTGASMAVTRDGRVLGSLSGGCVEGDAVVLAHDVLRTGVARTARFGFTDDQAHAAGMACGGSIDVLAYRLAPDDARSLALLASAAEDVGVSIGLVASGPRAGRIVPETGLPVAASAGVAARASIMLPAAYDGDDLLVVSIAPRPRLIILGAGEHAAALCRVGDAAGWAVTVCDAWEALVTRERFPQAAHLVTAFPHEYLQSLVSADPVRQTVDARTAICVLTHDERLDVPALRIALGMPVGFVGAMGARSTVSRRAALLRNAGVHEEALARLHSPLGLDLGAASPDDVALSVLAEITAHRHGATGLPLRDLRGPLHTRAPERIDAAPDTSTHAEGAASAPLAPAERQ